MRLRVMTGAHERLGAAQSPAEHLAHSRSFLGCRCCVTEHTSSSPRNGITARGWAPGTQTVPATGTRAGPGVRADTPWGLPRPNSLRPRTDQPPSNRFQLPKAKDRPEGSAPLTSQSHPGTFATHLTALCSQGPSSLSINTSHPKGKPDTSGSLHSSGNARGHWLGFQWDLLGTHCSEDLPPSREADPVVGEAGAGTALRSLCL